MYVGHDRWARTADRAARNHRMDNSNPKDVPLTEVLSRRNWVTPSSSAWNRGNTRRTNESRRRGISRQSSRANDQLPAEAPSIPDDCDNYDNYEQLAEQPRPSETDSSGDEPSSGRSDVPLNSNPRRTIEPHVKKVKRRGAKAEREKPSCPGRWMERHPIEGLNSVRPPFQDHPVHPADYDQKWCRSGYAPTASTAENMSPGSTRPHSGQDTQQARNIRPSFRNNVPPWPNGSTTVIPPQLLGEFRNGHEPHSGHPSAVESQSIMGTNSAFGAFDFGGFGADRQSLSTSAGAPISALPKSEKSFPGIDEECHTAYVQRPEMVGIPDHPSSPYYRRETPGIIVNNKPSVVSKDPRGSRDPTDKPHIGSDPDTESEEDNRAAKSWVEQDGITSDQSEGEANENLANLQHRLVRDTLRNDSHVSMHDVYVTSLPKESVDIRKGGPQSAPPVHFTLLGPQTVGHSSSSEGEEPAGEIWGLLGATRKKRKDKSTPSRLQGPSSERDDNKAGEPLAAGTIQKDSVISLGMTFPQSPQLDGRPSFEGDPRYSASLHGKVQPSMERAGKSDVRSQSRATQASSSHWHDGDAPLADGDYYISQSLPNNTATRAGPRVSATDLDQRKKQPYTYDVSRMSPPHRQRRFSRDSKIAPCEPWENPWQSSFHQQDDLVPPAPSDEGSTKVTQLSSQEPAHCEKQKPRIQKLPVRTKSKSRLRQSVTEPPQSDRPSVSQLGPVTPESVKQSGANTTDRELPKNSDRPSMQSRGVLPNPWASEPEVEHSQPVILGESLDKVNIRSLKGTPHGTRRDLYFDEKLGQVNPETNGRAVLFPNVISSVSKRLSRAEQREKYLNSSPGIDPELGTSPQSKPRLGTLEGVTISRKHRPVLSMDGTLDPDQERRGCANETREGEPSVPGDSHFALATTKSTPPKCTELERPSTLGPRHREVSPAPTLRQNTKDAPFPYQSQPEMKGNIGRSRHTRGDVERIPNGEIERRSSRRITESDSPSYSQRSSRMSPEQLQFVTRNTSSATSRNRSSQLPDKSSPFAAQVPDTKSSQLLATDHSVKKPSAQEGNRLEESACEGNAIDACSLQDPDASPPLKDGFKDRPSKTQSSAQRNALSKQPVPVNDRRPTSQILRPERGEVSPQGRSDQDYENHSAEMIRPHLAKDHSKDSRELRARPDRADNPRNPYQATVSEEDSDDLPDEGCRPVSKNKEDLCETPFCQPAQSSPNKARKRSRLTPSPVEPSQHPRQRRRRSFSQAVDMSNPSGKDFQYSDDEAPRPATANKAHAKKLYSKQIASSADHGEYWYRAGATDINNAKQPRDVRGAKVALAFPNRERDSARVYSVAAHTDEHSASPRFVAGRGHDITEQTTTPEKISQQHSRPVTHSSSRESEPKEVTPNFEKDSQTHIESTDPRVAIESLYEKPSADNIFTGLPQVSYAGANSEQPSPIPAETLSADKASENKPPASTGLIGSIWGLVKMGAGQPKPPEAPTVVPKAEEEIVSSEPSEVDDTGDEKTHATGRQPHAEAKADRIGSITIEPLSNEIPSAKPSKEQPPRGNFNSPDLLPYGVEQHDDPALKQPAAPPILYSDEKRRYRKAGDMPLAKEKISMSRNHRYTRAASGRIADQKLASLPTGPVRPTVAGDPLASADITAAPKIEKNADNTPLETSNQRQASPNRARGPSHYELQHPPSAAKEPAHSGDGLPVREERTRRAPAQPQWEAPSKEPQKPQSSDSRPLQLSVKSMALPQPPYPQSREASPRRRSLSTWELSDTGSESDEQDDVSHHKPPPPPDFIGYTRDNKPTQVPSESDSPHKRFSSRKPVARYDSEPEYEPEVTRVKQPRSHAKPRIQPLEQQATRKRLSYENEVHERSESDSPSDEDATEDEPETIEPLADVPIRKRGSRLISERPAPLETSHRRSFHTENPRPLVSDKEDQSSEEEKAYRRNKEARESERPRTSRRRSRHRERDRHSIPEISQNYPSGNENQPPRHKQDKAHKLFSRSPTREQESHQYGEPMVLSRPLQRTSTVPAPRMGGLLGSIWNNLRRPKAGVEEHDIRAASDDESHRGVDRRGEIPRRTQSHRHRRPLSAGAIPVHKLEPEPEPAQLHEFDAARAALEAKAERRSKRRLSREQHRLQQQKEERQADIRRQEAGMAKRKEEEEAQKRAERRTRKQSLKAKHLEDEEWSRRQTQEREAHLERSARMDRRKVPERAKSLAGHHHRRHSWAPDTRTSEAPKRPERDTAPERRPSRRSNHQHRPEDGGDRSHRHQREHHSDGKHRSSQSKHRKKDREPKSEPTYPSVRRGNNDKTASWVESQHTDPPEPPPIVATVVDLPGGEGHTISSDEEVRRALRKQARRRKKYGDMTDDEIEMQRAKRRMEREHARNTEGNGHISEVLPSRMGKWLKKFSR